MARWFVNPGRRRKGRKRGHGVQHRPRVRISGRRFILGARSKYKGKIHRVNPIIQNPIIQNPFVRGISMFNPHRRHHRRRHHYRHNPIIRNPGVMSGVTHAVRDPMGLISQGASGTVAAFLTISLANTVQGMIGLFTGTDIVSKVARGVIRAGVGGLVYGAVGSFLPRQKSAILTGVAIGAGGGFLFDLLGTRLVVGVGDTAQTPGMLFAGIGNIGNIFGGGAPAAVAGYGAYVRPMGAYVRPMGRLGMRGMNGIYGAGSMDALTGAGGDALYGS